MYFTYGAGNWSGGHAVLGATEPRTTWYFAEGYTGPGFDEYLTIMNPESSAASVRITYYLTAGQTVIKPFTAPKESRSTITVHDTALGVGRQPTGIGVSAKVESLNRVRLVVERPMYFTYGAGNWDGGHTLMGFPKSRV